MLNPKKSVELNPRQRRAFIDALAPELRYKLSVLVRGIVREAEFGDEYDPNCSWEERVGGMVQEKRDLLIGENDESADPIYSAVEYAANSTMHDPFYGHLFNGVEEEDLIDFGIKLVNETYPDIWYRIERAAVNGDPRSVLPNRNVLDTDHETLNGLRDMTVLVDEFFPTDPDTGEFEIPSYERFEEFVNAMQECFDDENHYHVSAYCDEDEYNHENGIPVRTPK